MTDLARVDLEDRPGLRVLHVRGEVDITNVDDVLADLERAVPNDVGAVVVDLSDTQYIDSVGVHMLFRFGSRLRDRRHLYYVRVPPDSLLRSVLHVAGLPSTTELVGSIDEIGSGSAP